MRMLLAQEAPLIFSGLSEILLSEQSQYIVNRKD